jgi:hypothetical protein
MSEKTTLWDIANVVSYLWKDENKDYYASDKPPGHIFESLMRLNEQFELHYEVEVYE